MWPVIQVSAFHFWKDNGILCPQTSGQNCSLSHPSKNYFENHQIAQLHKHEGFPEFLPDTKCKMCLED